MSRFDLRAGRAWGLLTSLALIFGLFVPLLAPPAAQAQMTMPATAAAAPDSTVFFHSVDLDTEGAQWQQTEDLLARVGLPGALDTLREEMLNEGASNGDFTEADLDALLGGEMAIVVTQPAVERLLSKHLAASGMAMESASATPMASGSDEGLGVAAVLLPGDPDAAWAYAERQVNTYAAQLGLDVQTSQEGNTDLIWVEGEARADGDSAMSDDPVEEFLGEHGRGAFAAGRNGNFIIAAKTPADITSISAVIDGDVPSLAEAEGAQDLASRLPGDALSFTYIDLETIFAALGPEMTAAMQGMMPNMPQEAWGGRIGLTFRADQPGFRIDSIATFPEGANLDQLLVDNSQAIVDKASQVPSGTFLYEAGILPPNALAGLPFTFSQMINGTMQEQDMGKGPMAMFPSAEEMEAEIAKAAQTLAFNPKTDLFDLLGDQFVAFVSFPTFSGEGMGLNGVAAIDTTDATSVSESIAKLVDWIGQKLPEATIAEQQVDGDTVYVLSDPQSQGTPSLQFGVVGNQVVVAVGSGLDELQSPPATSLADDEQFQQVMGALPSEFSTIAYIDIGQAIAPIMMLSGAYQSPQITDADTACADYVSQEEAQTALDDDPVTNSNLDLDYDGTACEDAFGASATPSVSVGSPENIRAFAMVSYRQDDAAGSSAILYIAPPGS